MLTIEQKKAVRIMLAVECASAERMLAVGESDAFAIGELNKFIPRRIETLEAVRSDMVRQKQTAEQAIVETDAELVLMNLLKPIVPEPIPEPEPTPGGEVTGGQPIDVI